MEHQDLLAALAKSQLELERAQQQIAELEALLAELPGIFERKFSQRLLSADNDRLQQGSPREEPLGLPLQPQQPRMGSRVRALWPQNQDPSVAA